VQVGPPSAVESITTGADSGSTLPPLADPTNIVTSSIGEKDVRSFAHALGHPLETTTVNSQRCQVSAIVDRHEQIDVLGVWLRRCDRSDQSDSSHAGNPDGLPDERAGELN